MAKEAAMSIFVGNLPFSASESDLRGLFAEYGDIDSVAIITDRTFPGLRRRRACR